MFDRIEDQKHKFETAKIQFAALNNAIYPGLKMRDTFFHYIILPHCKQHVIICDVTYGKH